MGVYSVFKIVHWNLRVTDSSIFSAWTYSICNFNLYWEEYLEEHKLQGNLVDTKSSKEA